MPTPTLEEYLETIYKLSLSGPVRPTSVAESMSVSGPTVTATLKRLEAHGLITRQGTEVLLTEEGQARSLDIVRKHRIAERFLVDVLGLDWQAAHDDACLLEHALSPRVLVALEEYLGNPSVCPHGHPIPDASGAVTQTDGRVLSEVGASETVRVLRVSEQGELLDYLADVGLVPGAEVLVVAVEPFGGPLTLSVGGKERAISRDVARTVVVG